VKREAILSPATDWRWIALIALIAAVGLWDPVGFNGGGADDGRYFLAAHCWLAHGPCIPANHWEGRWPVILPLSLSLGAFGNNEFAAALPSLLASAACALLLVRVGNRWVGKPVGYAAAAVLVSLPTFLIEATHPAVEPIELAFILASANFIIDERPLLAGLSLGLAFQTRETSLAALLPLAWAYRKDMRSAVLFLLGFGAPLAAELIVYGIWTGRPFLRHQLSMQHAQIASSELEHYDGKPPFFNRSLIENWKYEPGIHIDWLVDGFANLLVNLKTNLLFVLTPLLLWFYRPGSRRKLLFLVVSAFVYAATLIYVFAIDPKPRMFIPALAALALAFAAVAVRQRGPVIVAIAVTILPLSWVILAAQPRTRHWMAIGERWVAAMPGQISTPDPQYWLLSPKLRALPTSGRPLVLVYEEDGCRGPTVLRERSNALAVALGDPQALCLYRTSDLPQ
jgi:4-amino-4-deoxy-L-arabinose transferase-like glycosyltransferase